MNYRKWTRRLAIVLVVLSLMLGLATLIGQWYAKQVFIGVMEELLGGPVEVRRVALHLTRVEAIGVTAFESEAREHPLLEMERIELDLALWDALRGRREAETATVSGGGMRLRIDENGRLRNDVSAWKSGIQLPCRLLRARDLQLEVQQPGRNTLFVKGLEFDAHSAPNQLSVSGAAVDLLGSPWSLEFQGQTVPLALHGKITSEQLSFSTAEIAALPLVPARMARQVELRGVTPVTASFQYDEQNELSYRVTLSPRLEIVVPDADLPLAQVRGEVELVDKRLNIHQLRGQVADGQFMLAGQFEIQPRGLTGSLRGEVGQVSLSRLPRRWNLAIANRVQGTAAASSQLQVELEDSRIRARGSATITISQAKLAGFDALPIQASIQLDEFTQNLTRNNGLEQTLVGQAKVDVEVPELDFAAALRAAGIDAPELENLVSGRGACRGELHIPLATAADRTTYRAEAALSSPAARLGGIESRNIQAQVRYVDGRGTLTNLQAELESGGRITAGGEVDTSRGGALHLTLQAQGIPLNRAAAAVTQEATPLQGVLDGSLDVAAPTDAWRDVEAWRGEGRLHVPRLMASDQRFDNLQARLHVQAGSVTVEQAQARWCGSALAATGQLQLAAPHAYAVQCAVQGLDLANVVQALKINAPASLSGQASVDGEVAGQLAGRTWKASGSSRFQDLHVNGIPLKAAAIARWRADADSVQAEDAQAEVLGARLRLSASIPLRGESASEITGEFQALDPRRLSELAPKIFQQFQGSVSGDVQLQGIERLATARGVVNVRSNKLSVNSLALEETTARLSLSEGNLSIQANGSALGSPLSFQGSAPFPASDPSARDAQKNAGPFAGGFQITDWDLQKLDLRGRLSLDRIQLTRLWKAAAPQFSQANVRGVAQVVVDVRLQGPSFQPQGQGQLLVRDLRWMDQRLPSELASRIVLQGNSLGFEQTSFAFGGGRVLGDLTLRLDELGTGSYALALEKIDARALTALWPPVSKTFLSGTSLSRTSLSGTLDGAVNANFRGEFAQRRIDGYGSMQLPAGRFNGVPVRNLRAPVNWFLNTATGTASARVRLTQSDIAGGRIDGEMEVQWSRQLDLKGNAKISNIDLRSLAAALPFIKNQFAGRLSGNVNLSGRRLQSLDDLTGTFDVKLDNAQVLKLPVLNALAGSFGIGDSSNTFRETKIKGRLNRGVAHIERMTSVASSIHMFMEGKLTTRGQLDLNVTADTAELLATGVVVGLVRPTDLLRRRLIFLHLGGAARSPVVLPRTEKFVEQEVMLFFLPFGAY